MWISALGPLGAGKQKRMFVKHMKTTVFERIKTAEIVE